MTLLFKDNLNIKSDKILINPSDIVVWNNKLNELTQILFNIVSSYQSLFGNIRHVFYRINKRTDIDKKILSIFGYGNARLTSYEFNNFENILANITNIKFNKSRDVTTIKQLEKQLAQLLIIDMTEINIELYKTLKHTFIDLINFYNNNNDKIQKYNDYICKKNSDRDFAYWYILHHRYVYYNNIKDKYYLYNNSCKDQHIISKNIYELFQILSKIDNDIREFATKKLVSIKLDTICCTNMYKLPTNITKITKLEELIISLPYLKKFPNDLYTLTNLKNIHITKCYNLSNLGFGLDKFSNISINFDENNYDRDDNSDDELIYTMSITKSNNNLRFLHITPRDYDQNSFYPTRTPTTYLKFINNIYTNLPNDLKYLTIITDILINTKITSNLSNSIYYDKFSNILNLTNLPCGLQKLYIVTNCRKIMKLIDLKLPFGCELVIKHVKILPHIKYYHKHNNKDLWITNCNKIRIQECNFTEFK